MLTPLYLLGLSLILPQEHLFVDGHARLIEPPSRASAWRFGFKTPADYNDNGNNCGGRTHQHARNKGKCGICGDPFDKKKREHEYGGRYATGTIVRSFKRGQIVRITVDITSNHRGHMEFSICPMTVSKEVTQECLDSHRLHTSTELGPEFPVDNIDGKHYYYLKLPNDLECTHCVLQWKYIGGNNWGICKDGRGALGCGNQEEFRGCSDISIAYSTSTSVFVAVPLPTETNTSKDYNVSRTHQTTPNPVPKPVVTTKPLRGYMRCKGTRRMHRLAGIDDWCERNCFHTPSFCPPSHCVCTYKNDVNII